MKNIYFYTFLWIMLFPLLFLGCKKDNLSSESHVNKGNLILKLSNSGTNETNTRIVVAEDALNSRNLLYKWVQGESIHLYFIQGNTKVIISTTVASISADGRTAVFSPVSVPETIQEGDFTLIGSNNLQESQGGFDTQNAGFIQLPISDWYWTSLQKISDNGMRFYFKSQVTGYKKGDVLNINEKFKSLGYFLCIKLKNTGAPLTINDLTLASTDGTKWVGNSENSTQNDYPAVFNALTEEYVKKGSSNTRVYNVKQTANTGEIVQIDAWSIPLNNPVNLKMTMSYGDPSAEISTVIAKNIPALEVNKRYFLYALWNGTTLTFTDRNFTPVNTNEYTFTHNGHTYVIIKTKKTWEQAVSDAVSRGGHLVYINNAAEQNAVYAAIQAAGIAANYTTVTDGGGIAYVWIGATDKQQEGQWIWDGTNSGAGTNFWNGQGAAGTGNGSPIAALYNNWGGNSKNTIQEPDNYTDVTYSPNGQNAAAIALAGWPQGTTDLGIAGEWNDININNALYYIIEKE